MEQLGLFKVDSWPAPLWLYQVRLLLRTPAPAQTIRLAADGEKHVCCHLGNEVVPLGKHSFDAHFPMGPCCAYTAV